MTLRFLPAVFTVFIFFIPNVYGQEHLSQIKSSLTNLLGQKKPQYWGEFVPGVKTHLDTHQKVLALTLDACGSRGDGYDAKLIRFLVREKIPATLFINARWIDKNSKVFESLARNPLFEIENHGFWHKPCSVTGRSVYGLKGTRDIPEVIDEVELNDQKIKGLTGHAPKFYRSGGAYYDEIAVEVVNQLGYAAVSFSLLGDAGATYSSRETKQALLKAEPGDIIIAHMNHPEKPSSKGLMDALRILKKQGFIFARLDQYPLK